MRLRHAALAALIAVTPLAGPARADDAPPPVPGPLRPLPPTGDAPAIPIRKPVRLPAPDAPARPIRAWVGRLAPLSAGELARGTVRLDVAAHQIRIEDFAVTDGPNLEVVLVADDGPTTTAAVLAAKRVSLGRLKRIKSPLVLRFPAELDPAVYRSLIVWSRRDRAPRAVAHLVPDKSR
mgnify:CR=1 FL=1